MPGWIAAGTIAAGYLSNQSSKKAAGAQANTSAYAADLQKQASDAALAEQQRQFNIGQANLAPYQQVGGTALNYLSSMLMPGVPQYVLPTTGTTTPTANYTANGQLLKYQPLESATSQPGTTGGFPLLGLYDARNTPSPSSTSTSTTVTPGYFTQGTTPSGFLPTGFNPGDFQASPDYQFRFQQGQQALQNALNAAGMSASGRAIKEATNYGQGAASQEYGNWFNRQLQSHQQNQQDYQNYLARIYQLAGLGTGAVNTGAQQGANYANAVGNIGTQTAGNIGNIYTNSTANQAQIGMQNAANINNAFQSGAQNYLAYRQNQNLMNLLNNRGNYF